MKFEVDYYKILGLSFEFTPKDLKKSYRDLSKLYHPDKNSGEEAASKFKTINEGYKMFSDERLRQQYDNESKFGRTYDPTLELLNFEFSNSNVASTNVVDKMDGFKKNEMLHIILELDEFKPNLTYKRNVICSNCDGSGNEDVRGLNLNSSYKGEKIKPLFAHDEEIPCDICEKTGSYNGMECPGCKGNGYISLGLSKCNNCDGKGVVEKIKRVKIKEEDLEDGKLKITYMGNQSKYNGKMGNLYVIIKEETD